MGEHQNKYPISRTPFKGDENMLRNSIDVKQKIRELNEESDCEIGSPLKQDGLSQLDSKGSRDASIEMWEKEPELNQEEIDDINFISILMHVNGEDNELNIANDQQFEEICKLMNEYYGLNETKFLNKYEVWKKYIKNLRLKKRFEERSREGDITLDSVSEKKESKKEMIQRYTAFLSKLWFSKADPFLKAKYMDFFQDSEHKWGPNMIFKNLSK